MEETIKQMSEILDANSIQIGALTTKVHLSFAFALLCTIWAISNSAKIKKLKK